MVEPYDVVDLIRRTRDALPLSTDEIDWLVAAYTRGTVRDEQMAAWAMAVLFRGLDRRQTRDLTLAMAASGERMSFAHLGKPTVDKHSTGGVGDKATLPLAPLVASFGVAVPQLSGRGLGHTGGTLDKLESIPGWRADLDTDAIRAQLERVGAVIAAASEHLAPADRKLYALRDATATVESLPLIASSIMSKKIAEGTAALVLDVKWGSGAFLPALEDARALARTMVELGEDAGLTMRALITDMSIPLGRTAGNALEVAESVAVLAGGGPADVRDLVLALAREMLDAAGLQHADAERALDGGQAMDTWRAMVRAQGGDPDAPLPVASVQEALTADRAGVLAEQDARLVGVAAWRAGAGRGAPGERVSASAGVELRARPGDSVRAGDVLAVLHTDDEARVPRALAALRDAHRIAPAGTRIAPRAVVTERIGPH